MSETNDTNPSETELDAEHWLHAYEQMIKIRTFEEAANELYTSARMPGIAHLYIGEEAIAVCVCEALRQDDYITSTHRFHGHHVGDIDRPYRIREEAAEWAKRDPLKLLEDWLLKSKQAEMEVFERIQQDVKVAVDDAVAFALEAPLPNESEVERHVYA